MSKYPHMWRISHSLPTPPPEKEDDNDNDSASDTEDDYIPPTNFPFLSLPSEIRNHIYATILLAPTTPPKKKDRRPKALRDLQPLRKKTAILLVSRQIHNEAAYIFYSTKPFLLFPIFREPYAMCLRDIFPTYRPFVASLELNLGSSWESPPRSWRITKSLRLESMTLLRTLRVFVQCDPSQPVFDGFRISKDFYTDFAGELLEEILHLLPNLVWVQFDAYPSVQRSGDLMSRLLAETKKAGKKVSYGPVRGWVGEESESLPAENVGDG